MKELVYEYSDTITESYFGKRPEFEKCESCISSIRTILKNPKVKMDITATKFNKEMESQIKKVFGFKKVHMLWIDEVIPNAFTFCSSFVYRGSAESKYVVKDKTKGFYDTGHNDILFVCVYTGLITDCDLTNEEFMGVVLHEIGHNFDYSFYNVSKGIMQKLLFPPNGITPAAKESYYNRYKKAGDFASSHAYADDAYDEYLKMRDKIRVWDTSLKAVPMTLVNLITSPIQLIVSVLATPSALSGKKGENFADSFATAYGYGYGCMSGLEKLGAYPKSLKGSNKFVKVLYDLGHCNYEISNALFEIHVTNQERIELSILKLQNDLKKGDFPPEMKASLEEELKKLKSLQQKILTCDKDQWNHITVVYRKISQFLFKGLNIAHFIFPKNQA